MARAGEIPHSPYYGSIDATPLFVIVAEATHRFAGDAALPARAAARRSRRRSAGSTRGARRRRGSFATSGRARRARATRAGRTRARACSFPDGRAAEPPIALVEVQGYCADALRPRGEDLPRPRRRRRSRRIYDERAASMRDLRQPRCSGCRRPTATRYAIDGRDRVLPTVVSNIGHLLWSRVAPPDRATATAHTLSGLVELQRVRHSHARERPARLQPAQLPQRHGMAARQRAHRARPRAATASPRGDARRSTACYAAMAYFPRLASAGALLRHRQAQRRARALSGRLQPAGVGERGAVAARSVDPGSRGGRAARAPGGEKPADCRGGSKARASRACA